MQPTVLLRATRTSEAFVLQTIALIGAVWLSLVAVALRPAAGVVFEQHNLVSDDTSVVPAALPDTNLVNAWGLVAGPTTPWWVANNETGTSTLYEGDGTKRPLTVSVPGNPTGIVFNGGSGFVVTDGAASGAARFLFASEDGTISGWNPNVPPPPTSTQAFVAVHNEGAAVYKGLAIASTANGDFLYATNFFAGTVDVFDSSFNPVNNPGAFTDPRLPAGYAPFGIANLGGTIYVTYALQDADKEDDVPGAGHGFVDAYDTAGVLLHRVASRGELNSPWGLAMAPAGLGKFSNNLLVGNFGNGRIHAFVAKRRHEDAFHHHGPLRGTDGRPLTIDGLWALAFGNGAAAGPTDTLYFTAGPFDESHGLFGELIAVQHQHDDD